MKPNPTDIPGGSLAPPAEPPPFKRAEDAAQEGPLPNLTRAEMLAYCALIVLALVLRLGGLGTQPLSVSEAAQALVSWHLYQGQPVGQGDYSPLLATVNLIGFALFGASEFVARLGPALMGGLLVLLPMGLRRPLGRTGALAAAGLFAISPTALYLSRTSNGDITALVGGLTLAVGLFNWLGASAPSDEEVGTPGWWLVLGAAGLVLMITSSPVAYSMLMLLLIFCGVVVVVRSRHVRGLSTLGAALRQQWAAHHTALLGLLLAAGAIAGGLFFNPGGLAATINLVAEWAHGFVSPDAFTIAEASANPPSYPAAFLLTLYEPLVLLAGLFGLSIALMRRRLLDLFLVWWFFAGMVLDIVRAGRSAGEVLVPLLPIVLLAGLAIGRLIESLRREGAWQREGIIAAVGLIISCYAYVELMIYTRSTDGVFWLPVAAVGMFVVLVLVFWQWQDGVSTLRGAALTIGLVLLLFGVATTARLNYVQFADPSQPLVGAPTGEGVPDLIETLQFASTEKARDPYLIDITSSHSVGPAIEWQLRSFPNVTWVSSLEQLNGTLNPLRPGATAPSVIVATEGDLLTEEHYVGQGFVIRTGWRPQPQIQAQSLLRWFILRASPPTSQARAVLWVRQAPEAEAAPKNQPAGGAGAQ